MVCSEQSDNRHVLPVIKLHMESVLISDSWYDLLLHMFWLAVY